MKMDNEDRKNGSESGSEPNTPWVAWIAIGIGVFMVVVGGLLLLWGLSFQATVGETSEIDDGSFVGGPGLIPIGVLSIAFGSMWIHNGLKGFRKRSDERDMKNCPYCGKRIEEDLNFCYHCTKTFDDADEDMADRKNGSERTDEADEGSEREKIILNQRKRSERQEARRRKMEERERKAASLNDLSSGRKGQ